MLSSSPAYAQRIIGELESNADINRTLPDSSSRGGKEKVEVPVDIYAWTIDERFGNRIMTDVDTLHHQFQNNSLSEGINGHFNTLSNLGSPRLNRIFMERRQGEQFFFTDPIDQFFVTTDRFLFYNTKSPFMNIQYNNCGSKTTGYDNFKATFTNNAGKRINFGALFHYMYGQGYYDAQSTSYMNASAWGSYIGDRYDMHFYYQHNHTKLAENGGITDESYITRPEDLPIRYQSSDIPTRINNTWSKQEHDVVYLNHRYHIGFTRTEGDSTDRHDVFVPVTSIFHTLKLQKYARGHISFKQPEDFYTNIYLPGDSTNDRTKNFAIKNLVGLSLCEGFNKWAAAGINIYGGFDYRSFTIDDIPAEGFGMSNGHVTKRKYSESNVLVGGQILRTQGHTLHYNINGEFVVAGEDMGQFDVNGRGEANIPLAFLKDTMQVVIGGYVKNLAPTFYYRHYHGKNAWWDNDNMNKEMRTRIEGQLSIPRTRTRLTVSVENIKNYTYFANVYTLNGDIENTYRNNIMPMQHGDNIQVLGVNLRQDFKFGPLHIDNDVTYQTCTNKDVLPLPTLSLYNNVYLDFKIAKVLHCEIGGDMKFFTEYYAPDYSPALGQFMVQSANNKVKIGNYPLISVYANFDLKRTRFYLQYYHVNQSEGRYFWAPGYPMNPKGLHFGLSWNFFD